MKLFGCGEEEKKQVFIKNDDISDTVVKDSDGKEVTEMEDMEETKLLRL